MPSKHYNDCTSISETCPVEGTIYGYYPSLGANAFFCAFFAIFTIANIGLTYRFKLWFFGSMVVLGCAGETVGYIGRIILHSNPWSGPGFETQICTLIFSPSFIAAGLYLTLKSMARSIGPQYSPIKPARYPYIFIACDIFSLVLQAVGGGIAASSNTDAMTNAGGRIMLAGIVFQVVTFMVLYALIIKFALNLRNNTSSLSTECLAILQGKQFKIFALGMLVASLAIFVRCVYRIAELAGGWANSIMRDEVGYIILDGVMCCIAVIAVTVSHPGFWFKPMLGSQEYREKGQLSTEEIKA